MSTLNRPVMEITRPAALALLIAGLLFGLLLAFSGIPSPTGWIFNLAGVVLVLACLYGFGRMFHQKATSKR
jgi:4-hydroxybenzoate polyprenyltransferase